MVLRARLLGVTFQFEFTVDALFHSAVVDNLHDHIERTVPPETRVNIS